MVAMGVMMLEGHGMGSIVGETATSPITSRPRRANQPTDGTTPLDIRPEAMGLSWDQLEEGLRSMQAYVNEVGLWHSIAHDATITDGFITDLRKKLNNAYANK